MLQPVSGLYIVEEFVKSVGIEDGYDKFDKAVHERTGFHHSEQSPLKHVKAVTVPTLVAQVHDDTMTRPQDVQEIYDAIPVAEKSLYWMEGTDRRSFIITEDLAGYRAADKLLESGGVAFDSILESTADLAAKLHKSGRCAIGSAIASDGASIQIEALGQAGKKRG